MQKNKNCLRFIYLSDSHIGGDNTGYHRQVPYQHKMPEICSALQLFINKNPAIDFILHGGDMIDSANEENIDSAKKIFNLSIPTYLCLGNHDLTQKKALKMWLNRAPEFFINIKPEFVIEEKFINFIIAPTHWSADPYFWESVQDAHFKTEQKDFINSKLTEAAKQKKAVIFITHCQNFGVPASQTGLNKEIHSPTERYEAEVKNLIENHKNLKLILTAHSHINSRKSSDSFNSVTPSASCESPFEFKLITVTDSRIIVETKSLQDYVDFQFEYDMDATFVQADKDMRDFKINL